jgi:hypothetical protein
VAYIYSISGVIKPNDEQSHEGIGAIRND